MSWWDRYQAWQPESSWDRFKAWQLESRARYVATAVGLRTPIVLLYVWLFTGSSASRVSPGTATFVVLGILVYGWFWYPRAKAKSQRTSVPTRTTTV
jgi:hypothetical protein